jgi:hypothetical protein
MTSGEKQYFIVASHGWSASNWVAFSLNLHPQIACAHSSAALLADDPTVFDGGRIRPYIPQLRQGYVQRQSRPVDELYDEIERQKTAPFVGSVHTYRLRDLPVQAARFPNLRRSYRTINLVRHPLDVVVSGFGQFKDLFRIDLNEFSWTLRKVVDQGLDIVETVCARYGLNPGDYDVLCFFGACAVLGSLRLDILASQQIQSSNVCPWQYQGFVRMEEITRSAAVFAGLVQSITGREGLATADYLKTVFQTGPINVHNREAGQNTNKRWLDLEDWQREAFGLFLDRFDLLETYRDYGYDFDFMQG